MTSKHGDNIPESRETGKGWPVGQGGGVGGPVAISESVMNNYQASLRPRAIFGKVICR
jgi:hypothetical protein